MNYEILKVLVGSRAHHLANQDSDYDWRGVFVTPTSDLLKLDSHTSQTQWIEGKQDDTSWEIGKFLFLATKCNPTILEAFLAPMNKEDTYYAYLGDELRDLFPFVWNSRGVRDAFVGYGLNQRRKFLDNKDNRSPKYACAYLRTLYNAWELLSTGTFSVNVEDSIVYEQLKRFKSGEFTTGEVIQTCVDWEVKVNEAFDKNPSKEADLKQVNEFLLKVRKDFWE